MAIEMPKAGTIAGRSASLTVAEPETGAIVAEFGQRMQQHGMQWRDQQRQRELQKLQLDMTRDMGKARLEAEQLGDPVEIGTYWDQRQGEIQQKYVGDQTDPEVASAMGLAVQQTGDQHLLDLSAKQKGLEKSAMEADWIEARGGIILDAATADPTTFERLIELGSAQIDSRVAAGLVDPAGAAREKEILRQEAWGSRARAEVSADPAAWLEKADAGNFDALGGTDLSAMKLSAENELARRAKAEAEALKTAATERQKQIGTQLGSIASLASKGLLSEDEALLSDPEMMAHPKWAEAQAAVQLRQEIPGINMMTVTELDQLIAGEKTRPMKSPWEAKRVEVLKGQRDRAAAAYAADPVKAAGAAGIAVPVLPTFDAGNPSAFAAGIKGRVAFDEVARSSGRSKGPALFSIEEKKSLATVLDPKADAAPKVALAEAIISGTDGNPGDVLKSLEVDPIFRRSVRLMAVPGNAMLAEEILRGQQKIDTKTVILPSARDQTRIFDEITEGAFDGRPALKSEILGTAVALYADGAGGVDAETQSGTGWLTDKTAISLFTASVQRVMGATPDRNGNLTVGGLQDVNGEKVMLPPGIAPDEIGVMFDNLSYQLRGANWDTSLSGWSFAEDVPDSDQQRLRAFTAASVYGGAPDLGPNPDARLQSLILSPVVNSRTGEEDGTYEFQYRRNGRLYTVNIKGHDVPYHFRLSDLMREAGK